MDPSTSFPCVGSVTTRCIEATTLLLRPQRRGQSYTLNTSDIFGGYLDPHEAAAAALDQTDKALGAVISMLTQLYLEKRNIRMALQQLDVESDDDEIGELEWRLKMIRGEESSLHRIESGLQSRLKVG